MKIEIFQTDSFTRTLFAGNPAAVCILPFWISDDYLCKIAAENNLPETAFVVGNYDRYEIRWFTPTTEVDLCGHATLAAGYVITRFLDPDVRLIHFSSKSGPLAVHCKNDELLLDLPAQPGRPIETPALLSKALGFAPEETLVSAAHIAVLKSEELIYSTAPDLNLISQLDSIGLIITAPAKQYDCVSRCFFPQIGIPEDPVTGAAHCALAPYWSKRLGKQILKCRQASRRGGDLKCEVKGERVEISGHCVLYTRAQFDLELSDSK